MNNGAEIPVIGYGVYEVPVTKTAQLVYEALKSGYRHVDTAVVYENQKEAAEGVQKYLQETGTSREEIWFTTKLWNDQQGYEETKKALSSIAEDVKEYIGYVDLILLHSPLTSKEKRLGAWKALEEVVADPSSAPIPVKSIGVSNFGIEHLKELLEVAHVKPVLNQLELHPWLPHHDLRKFLAEQGIYAEAYSPLTQGVKLQDPELLQLESKTGISKVDLLLKWSFLQGFIVLVKSDKVERIRSNLNVLPDADDGSDASISLDDETWKVLDKPYSYEVLTWDNNDPTTYAK